VNYFNYFTEIEDAFVRRRGKHLLLSPMDWALIESWKEMQIPLHVALRGIERAFDSWEAKPRKRTVKSLLYCQEEVEAQYAEWVESRVGAAGDQDAQTPGDTSEDSAFGRAEILNHLQRARLELLKIRDTRKAAGEDDFGEVLTRVVGLIAELEQDFGTSTVPSAQKLEVSLTGLERMLSDAILSVVAEAQLESIRDEVKEQLRPYRKHMEKLVYEQTFDNLVLKRLREQFGVPRLSLFYL